MPVVDFEAAWYALKVHVASKRSHGAAELKQEMADLEVRFLIPEGEQGYDDRPSRPSHRTVVTPLPTHDASAA